MSAPDVADGELRVRLDPLAEPTSGRMSFIAAGEAAGVDAMIAAATRLLCSGGANGSAFVGATDFAAAVPDQRLGAVGEALGRFDRAGTAPARWPRVQDIVLPALFLAAIGIVLGLTDWTGPATSIALVENRNPVPLPGLPGSLAELARYPQRFGAYFADRFGLRPQMVALRGWLSLQSLQQSPSPLVMVGRQGWLFFTGNSSIENWRRQIPLSPAELDQWAARLAERQRWFAERGITYLFVVAPDKQTIYPEYMPRVLPPGTGATRLDQLSTRMAGDPAWLDLRRALRRAKAVGQVYFRTDTHWNDFGAYEAYRAIMERLGLPALAREPRSLEPAVHHGDLGRLSGVTTSEPSPGFPVRCAQPQPTSVDAAALDRLQPAGLGARAFTIPATTCARGRERLLIFQDSFMMPMWPYLSESFARAVYVWRMPTFEQMQMMVAAERPTVVIEQRVERFLTAPLAP